MNIPIRRYFHLFKRYLIAQQASLIGLGVLLILTVGISLTQPQLLSRFIDLATEHASTKSLIQIAILFITLAIFQQFILVWSTYLSQNIGWKATNALREDLIDHCMKLDLSFHKTHKPGELIERLDGDVTALFNFFANLSLKFLNNIALLIGIIILLFLKDYRVGSALFIFSILALFVLSKFQKIAVPRWVKERQISAEFYGFVGEQITSTDDIRSLGAISYVMYRLYEFLKQWYKLKGKAFYMYGYMWSMSIVLFAAAYTISLSLGAYLYSIGALSIGSVYLIVNYTDLLERPIEQIRAQLQDLQKAGASIERVEGLFALKTTLKDGTESILGQGAIDLIFQDVTFSYEDQIPVLNNISFTLEKGQILGLLGRTGSGKTSLARLLVRLYDSRSGQITFNQQAIQNLSIKELRQSVAFVTQDVQLFHASIRNNLTFYNPDISDSMISDAIAAMGLQDWFRKFSNGFDTLLEADGSSLSAGEAQLLSFIRVFLKNPRFVILDEASSRLDPITEQLIEQAISKLLIHKTCIIIAHRLKTIERADKILILDHGRILEQGRRMHLMNDPNSTFSHLLSTGIEEVLI